MKTHGQFLKRHELGMTLLEIMIAGALLSVLLMFALLMTRSSAEFYSTASINGAAEIALESTLNEIINELIESRASLITQPTPLLTPPSSSSALTYRRVLRYDAATGISEYGPLSRIALEGGSIYVTEGIDTASPKSRILADRAAPLITGEIPNGVDDNGNGLIDEAGLAFVLESPHTLRIYLSLERKNANGTMESVSGTTLVQLRNR